MYLQVKSPVGFEEVLAQLPASTGSSIPNSRSRETNAYIFSEYQEDQQNTSMYYIVKRLRHLKTT